MLLAYVVTSADRISDGSLHRFLQSANNQDTPIKIYLGLRGCELSGDLSKLVSGTKSLPSKISISRARNELINCFPPATDSWVCFPDDDCWYPEQLLKLAMEFFPDVDLVLGAVDTGSEGKRLEPFRSPVFQINLQTALSQTASAALFVSGSTFGNFKFDERLGLGAQVGSAEDLDLVLHVLSIGKRGVFSPGIRVHHPFKPARKLEYFEGSIAALSKYFKKIKFSKYSALRRLIKGCLLVLFRKLPFSQLKKGWSYFWEKW